MTTIKGRPKTDLISKNKRGCIHGTCKTYDKTNRDPDVFFLYFAQPCAIFRNNQVAIILGQPYNKHSPHDCPKCSKALRWVHLCKRPTLKGLDNIRTNTYICSKHFINPDPIKRKPHEDHPDPFNATLTDQQIQKLKNSKRKKPTDRSAVVVTKKTRITKNVSENTLPNQSEEAADNPQQNLTVNSINEAQQILSVPAQQQDDGPCISPKVNSVDATNNSESLLVLPQEKLCNSQNINNNECAQILPTPVQEQNKGPCSSSNANSINKINKLPSKSPLILERKELCTLQNVNSHIENSNSTAKIWLIPVQYVTAEARNSQHLQSTPNVEIVKKLTSNSTQVEAKDNLECLVTKYAKLKWFTNLDGETASFLKLSEDNLQLFTVKVTDNTDNTFAYELFMFNQCAPIETSEKVLLEEVEDKLKQLFKANVCQGVISDQVKKYFTAHQGFTSATLCHITGGLRSNNCRLFSDNEVCVNCRNIGRRIRHLIKRESERKEPHRFTTHKNMSEELLRKKLIESAKNIRDARDKIVRYKKTIERLKKENETQNQAQNFSFSSIFYEDD